MWCLPTKLARLMAGWWFQPLWNILMFQTRTRWEWVHTIQNSGKSQKCSEKNPPASPTTPYWNLSPLWHRCGPVTLALPGTSCSLASEFPSPPVVTTFPQRFQGPAKQKNGETARKKPSNTSRKRSKSHYSWLILFKSFQISSDIL